MSDHQETLEQAVKRIEASFAKIETYGKKVEDFRSSAGKQLVELQVRIEAGEAGDGVKWWHWYAEHFKNRTRRDAQRVMALARADDPEAAAEEAREKTRKAVAAHRQREAEQQAAATYSKSHWTEEDYAAQIVRDVQDEVANLEGEVADFDLLRELILQKLTFAFGGDNAEASTEARKALCGAAEEEPAKKRGRPPGSKNKPKVGEAAAGNGVDTEASAEEMKAKFDEPDLTIPESMRRHPEAGATS